MFCWSSSSIICHYSRSALASPFFGFLFLGLQGVFEDPDGKKYYTRKGAEEAGMPADETMWSKNIAKVPEKKVQAAEGEVADSVEGAATAAEVIEDPTLKELLAPIPAPDAPIAGTDENSSSLIYIIDAFFEQNIL